MADSTPHELIIVRRHDEEEHPQHSSAWKVAHADFMTAMMAFFLIMWLINVTDQNVRKGIAQYFNPIHMSQGSTELKGLSTTKSKDASARNGHSQLPTPGAADLSLIELTPGHGDAKSAGKPINPEAAAAALNAAAEVAAKLVAAGDAGHKPPTDKSAGSIAEALKKIDQAAADLKPPNGGNDREAFQDPYAVLAKLEQKYVSTQPTSVDAITGDPRATGTPGGEVERDPFDPSYWQMVPLPTAKANHVGKPGTMQKVPGSAKLDAAALSPAGAAPAANAADTAPETKQTAPTAVKPAAPATVHETVATKDKAAEPAAAAKAAEAATAEKAKSVAPATVARSSEIAKDIKTSVATMMAGSASPKLAVAATHEGVTINLTDDADFAMFAIGSAVPAPKTVVLLERIAKVLEKQPGQIVVRGDTDGRPFHSADYDNWRLSSARAQMAYYALVRGGLDKKRVVAIEGRADRALKNPADPYAAENRRIEILVKDSP